jgi:MtaA/CmuA family methyltransferase
MEQTTDLAIRYARAHIVAGSDVIQFGESTASGDMISPTQYGEHVMPYHCRLIEGVAGPTVLNITGDITDRLDMIAGTGASAICVEDCVDLHVARQTLENRMALVGNVPIVTLSEGTPDIVSAHAREAISGGVDLLNPAGTLLTDTPGNNLEAMVAVATGA